MSNYMRRPPLRRRPTRGADPGELVDLGMEEGSWRQGFFTVGMRWPAKRMRVSPSATPGACPAGTGERGVECGLTMKGASHRWPAGYRVIPGPTHMSVLGSNLLSWGYSHRRGAMKRRA